MLALACKGCRANSAFGLFGCTFHAIELLDQLAPSDCWAVGAGASGLLGEHTHSGCWAVGVPSCGDCANSSCRAVWLELLSPSGERVGVVWGGLGWVLGCGVRVVCKQVPSLSSLVMLSFSSSVCSRSIVCTLVAMLSVLGLTP
jgi:hypothetical protein